MFYNNTLFENKLHQLYNTNRIFIKMIFDYNLINFSLCVKDDKKNTLLHLIVLNNDNDTLLSFMNHLKIASYEKKYIRQILDAQNSNGDTPLHIAVKNNNQIIAEKLYNCGASTNIPNKDDFAVKFSETDTEYRKSSRRQTENSNSVGSVDNILDNMIKTVTKVNNNNTESSDKNTDNLFNKIINKIMNNTDDKIGNFTTEYKTDKDSINTDSFVVYINNRTNQLNDKLNNRILFGGANNDSLTSLSFNNKHVNETESSSDEEQKSDSNELDTNESSSNEELSDSSDEKSQKGGSESNSTELESLGIFYNIKNIRKDNYMTESSDISSNNSDSDDMDGGRKMKREKETYHQDVLEIIKKLGYGDDAPFIKAALWKYIKDNYPNDSNFDKSKKMFDLANSSKFTDVLKTLDIEAIKAVISSKVNQSKPEKSSTKSTSSKKVKEEKTKKVKEEKPKKEKKTSSKKTKRTSRKY